MSVPITYVCHPALNWNIGLMCENEMLHRLWSIVFGKFMVSFSLNGRVDENRGLIEVHRLSNEKYQIQNTNLVLDDMESVVGLIQEIAFSHHFLISDNYTFFHGAVLEKGGQTVLLIAPTRMGKTTITALLCTRGYRYLSDDVIAVNNSDLSVVTFPKILTIRDMGLIENFEPRFTSYVDMLNFYDKSIDNTTKKVERRVAVFPKRTEEVKYGNRYKIGKIYVLKREEELGEECHVRQCDEITGFLCLLRNLRSSTNLAAGKEVARRLNAEISVTEIQYGKGFQILRYF